MPSRLLTHSHIALVDSALLGARKNEGMVAALRRVSWSRVEERGAGCV